MCQATPSVCLWIFKGILQIMVHVGSTISHITRNEDTFLWLDPLHATGILELVVGDYIDYEIFTNPLARVFEICKDGVWVVGHPHSLALIPVWDAILDIITFPHSRNDCVV